MKKILFLFSSFILGMSIISIFSFSTRYPDGALAAHTGSPGDKGITCTECHGGTATPITEMISTNIPITGYIPDSTYTITVSLNSTAINGFEITAQDTIGNYLGTLIPTLGNRYSDTTKKSDLNRYVTHSFGVSGPAVWNIHWKAPSKGTGDVHFYSAGIQNYAVVKSQIIVHETLSSSISEITNEKNTPKIYPNPSVNTVFIEINEQNTLINIYDLTGTLISTQKLNDNKIDVSNLKIGTYIIQVGEQEKSYIQKFIKI